MTYCANVIPDRRRTFWTTQPNACGTIPDDCNSADCGLPGLAFNDSSCNVDCCCGPATLDPLCSSSHKQRTIATNDWIRGLVLNILGTHGRLPNTTCGYRIGEQGGHWSDSFRKDGQSAGNLIHSVGSKKSYRDIVAAISARVQADLNKLIGLGIAKTILVTANYLGGARMNLNIDITSPDGVTSNVGLTGTRATNSWIWK